ncbi:hypothetical protein [Pseudoalteromonas sp. G4]|uniref:hypothetical protein n=1 Tax=Pseudoalteromonas sp. G4 TaxID=2992761 RepID=UPI00237E8B01|nr:hypothetical protein [Pseudoalteromonas sp. G4]MDE3270845.1 hypothetical protein [Pseudoalteromonas sp. G4]
MDILNNSWIIGIGTGILSGIIVTFITRKIFTKKDERETAQNIASANREIMYALRPGISDGHIPEKSVLESLRNATARHYKLEPHLLFSPKSISEELIKEIMDSSFISSETKRQYCDSLNPLLSPENPVHEQAEQLENTRFVARIEYRERMTMLFSLTIGLIAAMATVYTTIKSKSSGSIFSKAFDSLMPTIFVLGGTILLMNVFIAALKMRHKRLREEYGVPAAESSNNQRQSDT